MNRLVTNFLRFVLDDCVPPLIRDSKLFMYPLYCVAYRGKKIEQVMNFKSLVYNWTPEEYANFYLELDSVSRNRETDLSGPCIRKILNAMRADTDTLFDMGCGHGYLLERISQRYPSIKITGCDLKIPKRKGNFNFLKGDLFDHRFADQSFDVVTCCHTIEHLIDVEKYIAELKRLAKKQLIIVVPRQRYYYYTLDEHVNFFPDKDSLIALVGLERFRCESVFGDWVYVGECPPLPLDHKGLNR